VAFVSDREDHRFIGVHTLGEPNLAWIAPSVDRDTAPRWSRDGQRIAFLRTPGRREGVPIIPQSPMPWAIWVAEVPGVKARALWRSGERDDDSLPPGANELFFFTDDDRIVFASEQDGRKHLYSIAATGGAAMQLTRGAFDVEDARLSADGRSVLYTSNQDDVDRRHLWRVSAAGGAPAALTRGDSIEWAPVETGDGKHIVFFASDAVTPAMPHVLTPAGRRMLAQELLAGWPAAELVAPQQVIFKTSDGYAVHGQLFVPKQRAAKMPAVIFMHGGPPRHMMLGFHNRGYYHNAYAANQYLANRGYVVLSVNYRLGIMYGRAFRQPPNAGWRGASEYNDILAAAAHLKSLPYVDAQRIGLWGGSYGGYLTALGLARNSDIFAAGVDVHGVHDWSERMRRLASDDRPSDWEQALKLAWKSSPVASMKTWKSPVLLIHGDDDRNVAFSQTTDLVHRLREQNVPFEQLVFPDELHSFLLWRNWVTAFEAMGDFFDRKLKTAAPRAAQ
jgi:dipeptidyl aminopeptidase/acylaminoacyl peptidase